MAQLKAKTEANLDKEWVWGGLTDERGSMGWTRCIQKETLRRENWKFGRRRDWVGAGVNGGRKDHAFTLGTI